MGRRIPEGQWALDATWKACFVCGTSSRRHYSKGRCGNCWSNYRYSVRREITLAQSIKRYWERKGSPEYMEEHRVHALQYRTTVKYRLWKIKDNARLRFTRFIKNGFTWRGKALQGCVRVRCDCCGKDFPTPIKISKLNNSVDELVLYRKLLTKHHYRVPVDN